MNFRNLTSNPKEQQCCYYSIFRLFSLFPILKVNLYVFYVPLRVRQLDSNGGFVFEYTLDADVKEGKTPRVTPHPPCIVLQ